MKTPDWTAVRVPARTVRLSNGLTVVAHHGAPSRVVAVYVAYRAGSRDEPESKFGLAHLCEHLMFTGTRSAPGSYFVPMEQVGAAWINAYVNEDYSAYFATVPVWALDFLLRMEADRMAHLAESLDSTKIDRQREVVRNELRQRESAPFGRAARVIAEIAHPPRHPYAHPSDGIVEQLDGLSDEDVRGWIETRHRPANAAVVIAGDIEPDAAIQNVRRHFEKIAPETVTHSRGREDSPTIDRETRRVIDEPGAQTRLYMIWNGPLFTASDAPALALACDVLAGGKSSRLWRSAVDADGVAAEVGVQMHQRMFGCQVILSATPRSNVPLEAIETAVLSEVERLHFGADREEVEAARLRMFGRTVRALERVGGPNSKSEVLGIATMLGAGPRTYDERISAMAAVDPGSIAAAAVEWLGSNRAIIEMRATA